MGSLAFCILLPDGSLCSTTGAEPEALSVPFSSCAGVLSHTPLPAGNRAAMKAGRDLMCKPLALKSLGPGCSWALLKFQVVFVRFIKNTLVLVLHLHKNSLVF